jgi:retron-type reverse transcriptase
LADKKARLGKSKQFEVIEHDKNKGANILAIYKTLKDKSFNTSEYKHFIIFEPKERKISMLPYYPDRIIHHGIMNVLEPIFNNLFTADTYSSIKGRGIHLAAKNLKKTLVNQSETKYCLKLDIQKFYPSINHNILKSLLRNKFKDKDLLYLLDNVIDSHKQIGVPIGNYLSQFFANLYLTPFDHWLKEIKGVSTYFRYADDIVILSNNKTNLHSLLSEIRNYFKINLELMVKSNYQIFPVNSRGIDFVGYKFYHTHTLLRKRIKKNFAKMMIKNKTPESIAGYNGWLVHCDAKHLVKTILK